jgi:3-oxoadipate enol-lactonase
VVVLTGGLALSHNQFDFVTPFLKKSYRVLNWDRRNVGRSGKSSSDYVNFGQHARDLKAILDSLGIEKAHHWGTGTGPLIDFTFAIEYPERTGALVEYPVVRGAESALKNLGDASSIIVTTMGVEAWARFSGSMLKLPEKMARWHFETFCRNLTVDAYLFQHLASQRTDLTEKLSMVKAPLLVLAGDGGSARHYNAGVGAEHPGWRTIKKMVPHAELAVVKNAIGSAFVLEKPGEATQIAVRFLAKHPIS